MTRALVFDSGVGGLSVVAEIRKRLPALRLDYAADDAFRPYGEKTPEQLRARLPGLVRTLADMAGADIIIIACNTASVTALADIRAESRVPVVGVVPAVKPAALATQTGAIGVLGTPATIRQSYVDDLIRDFAPGQDVRLHGSVALVRIAEDLLEGMEPDPDELRAEVAPLFSGQGTPIDTVVLACTHFPLLRDHLAAVAPRPVQWVDSGQAIARRVESLLPDIGDRADRPDTAFLIGPEVSTARCKAFKRFGFPRVVPLEQRV